MELIEEARAASAWGETPSVTWSSLIKEEGHLRPNECERLAPSWRMFGSLRVNRLPLGAVLPGGDALIHSSFLLYEPVDGALPGHRQEI